MRAIAFLGNDELLCGRIRAATNGLAAVSMLSTKWASYMPAITGLAPALILVELDDRRDPEFLSATFAGLAAAGRSPPVVVVGNSRNAADVLAAVRAGSVDFIDRDEALGTLRDRLERQLLVATAVVQNPPGSYSVIFNAQPGSASGSFALDLAITRASRSEEALFIDCQLPHSEAGAALDVTLAYSLGDAGRDVARLDRTLLLSAMARHDASGLRVLPLALHQAGSNDLSPETFLKTLRAIRPLFVETIVNAADIREPLLLDALSQWASTIYLVCPQKFTALSDTKNLLKALPGNAETLRRIVLIVDDHDPAITLSPAQMLAALGLTRVISLPTARADHVNGLNFGRPYLLSHPASAYAQAINAAAGVTPAATAGRAGMLHGLLGRFAGGKS
ncbi:AAA family ATPase [Glacieibacterium sp.]|uniref:AAA family ATPase n=1 Tax=Glacieibacterium sp. TaxID=2860237 RepID=UPI003B005639